VTDPAVTMGSTHEATTLVTPHPTGGHLPSKQAQSAADSVATEYIDTCDMHTQWNNAMGKVMQKLKAFRTWAKSCSQRLALENPPEKPLDVEQEPELG
jgi:hypothetical protein